MPFQSHFKMAGNFEYADILHVKNKTDFILFIQQNYVTHEISSKSVMKTTTEYPYKLSMLDAAIQATWYVNLICHYVRSTAYSKLFGLNHSIFSHIMTHLLDCNNFFRVEWYYVRRPEDIILWELSNFSLTLQYRDPNYTTDVLACVITSGQQNTTNIIMHVSFAHHWPLMISCSFRQQSGFLAKWSTKYLKLLQHFKCL